ncbi:MAG: cytochrome c biogenesis protein CcsA [Bacteroidales bacterium]|nr:cytochrome c biogenesis protein CcsA [Bacteroidales bacterium]MDD4669452.1 cytochrome c biogenesis protein CcsA [Bacteroidales bacterium]
MSWSIFWIFAICAMIFWYAGALCGIFSHRRRMAIVLTSTGVTIFGVFIIGYWITIACPPLRTMGETRLWYSFFMSIAGLLTYCRWKFKWILSFSAVLSSVFALINIFRPEIHSQVLMPALQSIWFIPHVTIYMFSYALLGCATVVAVMGLFRKESYLQSIDRLVTIGLSLFAVGMLLGAIWAKQAWGDFWTWDIKETWALVTFMLFGLYLHLRKMCCIKDFWLYILILISFAALQICWWGVNYLPWAAGSVHVYS